MAVNKNFVVKNGLEVNDNLLVADVDTQKVGIGTSVSSYQLHVLGGQIGVGETARDQTLSHSYDPSTDSWSTQRALPFPLSRVSGGTFAFEGRIFLIGGRTREGRRRRLAGHRRIRLRDRRRRTATHRFQMTADWIWRCDKWC